MTIVSARWDTDASADFNTASYWSDNTPPTADTYAQLVSYANAYTVTSSINNTVEALQVTAPATLAIQAGLFTVYTAANGQGKPLSAVQNTGTISVAAGASFVFGKTASPSTASSFLNNSGTVTTAGNLVFDAPGNSIRGAGTIVLSGGKIIGTTSAGTLHNHDNTISGSGTIGSAQLVFDNEKLGTMNASAATALTLNTGANQIYNAGKIETTGTGGLTIDSSMSEQGSLLASGTGALKIVNAVISGGGNVSATAAKAVIDLSGGTLSIGGTVSTAAGSSIVSLAKTTNTLDSGDVENAGTLSVANGSTMIIGAFLHNTGTIQMLGSTAGTTIEIDSGNTSLSGTGKFVMSNAAENAIVSTGVQAQFTNRGSMSGAGTIGDADLRFVNLTGATLNANGSVALNIVGDSASGESSDFNSGVIETTGAGGLTIDGVFGNAGTIEAVGTGALDLVTMTTTSGGLIETTKAGASIVLDDTSLSGGTLTIAAGSSLNLTAGSVDSILETNSNAGTITVANGATMIGSDNHWSNSGTIVLDGTSSATKWEVGNASANSYEQLVGGGKVNLTGADSSIVSNGSAATLRNVNNTITGGGTIGDANLTLQNQLGGTIDETGTTGLTIDTGSNAVFNDGIIESSSLAGVLIDSTVSNNGTLASSAGNLHVAGAVNNGGIANITGSGEIEFGLGDQNDVHFGAGASGTLRLDHSATAADAFDASIYGFAGKDTIDLGDIAYAAGQTKFVYAGTGAGTLTVSEGSTSTSLSLIGNYTQSSFVLSSDGHGGTFVKL